MIQAPWQSTFPVSQSPILGLQSIHKNLYLFQRSLISVFQSFNHLTTLVEQRHLLAPLRSYCINNDFIGIVTEYAVEVRRRDKWQDVIYEMKSEGVKGIMIRDGSLIVEHVDEARTYLHFMNLTSKIKYEVELGPIFNYEADARLEKRVIVISHIGRINDVYVYQNGAGTIQSGIFLQLTSNRKKTYPIGTIESLRGGKIRSIFRHSILVEGMTYQTQLIVLIVEWKQEKLIDLVVHEVLSSDQQLQKLEGSGPTFQNYEPFSQFQDIMNQFSLLDKEIDKEIDKESQAPQRYIKHLIDNDEYEFSCQDNNIIWVSTIRSILKIQLSQNISVSSRQFVKKVQKQTKNRPFIGIHENIPLFKDQNISITSTPTFNRKQSIEKSESFTNPSQKVQLEIQTQEVWVEDEETQTQLTVSNLINHAQTQTKVPIKQETLIQTLETPSSEFATQTNRTQFHDQSVDASLKQSEIPISTNQIYLKDQSIDASLEQNDVQTQTGLLCYIGETQTQNMFQEQMNGRQVQNVQPEQKKNQKKHIQIQVEFFEDVSIQTQSHLKEREVCEIQTTQINYQREDQTHKKQDASDGIIEDTVSRKLWKEVFECESQTDSKSSLLQIQCSSIQQIIYNQKQERKKSIFHWVIEPIQFKSQKQLQFGTHTEIEMIGLDPYQDQQLKRMNNLLNNFSQTINERLSNNISSLQNFNLKAKSQIQNNLKTVAKQFSKSQIGKQLEVLLIPLVQKSMNLLLQETKTIFQEGLMIFKQKTHEISATSQTFNKQYAQGLTIFDEVKKMVTEFGLVMKAKRINDLAVYNSMQNQISILKDEVLGLTKHLQAKLNDEKQLELKITKGFEEITRITQIIQEANERDLDQESQDEQESQDQDDRDQRQQLPSVVGSLINSQSPSYYQSYHPNYPYMGHPMNPQTSIYPFNGLQQPQPFYPGYMGPPQYQGPQYQGPQMYPQGYPVPRVYSQSQSNLKSQIKPQNAKKKKTKNKQHD